MKKITAILMIILSYFQILAQNDTKEEKKFGITFSGFVKNDFIFDSRQTVSIREGHFLLYPMGKSLDKNGVDVNAKPNFNFLAIQTRLTGNITGPDAFGAKTSGMMEGAFFGHTDADINGFRLRHAYVNLDWGKRAILMGQTWHPMFISSCFPNVISFNTGVPFQPFSRNPQFRYTEMIGKLSLIGTAYGQRDFSSPGGSLALRNSAIPALNLKAEFKNKSENKEFLAGIGGDYKVLHPRLITDSSYEATGQVKGMSAIAYVSYKNPQITFRAEGIY